MNERLSQLSEIDNFLHKIDAEVTLVLQNLQWDRQQILMGCEMVTCLYDKGHSIPAGQKTEHEEKCLLRSQGYSSEDKLLPDPPDVSKVVKFDESEINQIIENAARTDPQFKKGPGIQGPQQPLSADRLQSTFTSDERRAIHDAVIAAAPAQEHRDLDLKMPSSADKGSASANRAKSQTEVLAELRDMKRRRTKYRVVAKTKNYSDALRDVIQTQMELYSEVTIKSEPDDIEPVKTYTERNSNDTYNKSERDKYRDPSPTHTRQPKYEYKERDRYKARFSDTDRDRTYSKDEDYKRRDRSHSRISETGRDREIKKERNESERERPYKTNRDNNNEDANERDRSTSRNGRRNKNNETERNTRYWREDKRERDRSEFKYNYEEKADKHDKYSSTSKYQNYNSEKGKYKDSSNDEGKNRRNDNRGIYKEKGSMSNRDGRYGKDRDGKRY